MPDKITPMFNQLTNPETSKRISLNRVSVGSKTYDFATRFKVQNTYDDAAIIAPVYTDSSGEKRIILEAMLRPTLLNKADKQNPDYRRAISIETPGGLATDDPTNKTMMATARKELDEEVGATVTNLTEAIKGLVSAPGITDETCSIYVADCEDPGETVSPSLPDSGELAVFSLPLKQAFQYLFNLGNKGISIGAKTFTAVTSALKQFKLSPDFGDSSIDVKRLWTMDLNNSPKPLQEFALTDPGTQEALSKLN